MTKDKTSKFGCPLCALSREDNMILKRKVISGDKSVEEVAAEYAYLGNITADLVREHIYYHSIEDDDTYIGLENLYDRIINIVKKLEYKFNLCALDDSLGNSEIKNITAVSRELRETIKLLITLEEEVGSKKGKKELSQLKVKYETIKRILLSDLCSDCSEKVFSKLEKEKLI